MLPGYTIFQMAELIDYLSEQRYPDAITPEGFCFCIKKEVKEKIGIFDEIFGTGYCEESDYSMRAINNNFRTVCIDDLYIFHKRMGTFKTERNELYLQNRRIFDERWKKDYKSLYKKYMYPIPIQYLRDRVLEARNQHHYYHFDNLSLIRRYQSIKSFLASYKGRFRSKIKNIGFLPTVLLTAKRALSESRNLLKMKVGAWHGRTQSNGSQNIHRTELTSSNSENCFSITFLLSSLSNAGGGNFCFKPCK